jgi:hypothetical protein
MSFVGFHIPLPFLCLILFLITGCAKTEETYEENITIQEMLPLYVGKETYYRLDSTIIALSNNNTTPVISRYLLKEVVSSIEKDNLNQDYWKVNKYINKNLQGEGVWKPDGFYFVTYLNDRIEVTENNLRFIKLVRPIRQGYTWYGNRYLPDEPLKSYFIKFFTFDNIEQNMKNWLYTYKTIGLNDSLPNIPSIDDVITIEQINENNIPNGFVFGSAIPFNGYASKEYAVEKYAKGKGLIYQEYDLWEYQNNKNETKGYRLKKWLVNQ